jgi:hypothetical protein
MSDTILHDKELSNSFYSHIVNAPVEPHHVEACLGRRSSDIVGQL